jgi:hypothetical protein
MPFEANNGLNVSNFYGPRDTGGTRGVIKTVGSDSVFSLNLDLASAPTYKFPVPKAGFGSAFVTQVDISFSTGPVTALTIGGVAVFAATAAAPVAIAPGNTGIIVQTGGTAGTIHIRFKNISG